MRPRGFTLIEIVLAITITAIMMGILYGVVTATLRTHLRVEEEIFHAEVGPSLLAQIRRDLEAVFQPDAQKEYFAGIHRIANAGAWDRLDFLSVGMAYGTDDPYEDASFHSVNEVGYQIQANPQDPSLGVLYRRLDYFVDEDATRGGHLAELYPKVRSFAISYYDGTQWLPEWATLTKEGKLPQAVRVELKVLVPLREGEEVERAYQVTVTRPT